MSFDFRFVAKLEGIEEYATVGYLEANITYNVGTLIRKSTNWDLKNGVGEKLTDLIPKLLVGIRELTLNEKEYQQYEPANGWGNIEGVINLYENIIKAWKELKEGSEEIANIAHIYIS